MIALAITVNLIVALLGSLLPGFLKARKIDPAGRRGYSNHRD